MKQQQLLWDPYAEFEKTKLPNGLDVHVAHWPSRPWVAMGFMVHTGADRDPEGLEGMAHFIEHMVSDNTVLGARGIKEFFAATGGGVSLGSTSYSHTIYSFFAPTSTDVLNKALDIFGRMLLAGRLANHLERERQVIVGEYHQRFASPYAVDMNQRFRDALYWWSWRHRFPRPLGTLESIGRIGVSDIEKHYASHYTPANMSVVCVGGLSIQEVVLHLSTSPFATMKEGARTPLLTPLAVTPAPRETRYESVLSKVVVNPPKVGGYETTAILPGTLKGEACSITGMMLGKILDDELRQKRAWTYHAGVSGVYLSGFHEVRLDCGRLALSALDDVEQVVDSCLARAHDESGMFEAIRAAKVADMCLIDPNGRGVRDGALSDLADDHRIISFAECIRDTEVVTMDDIREVLSLLAPDRRYAVLSRP